MTRYEKLRDEFKEYNSANKLFADKNNSFARLLLNGFRDYMEAPKSTTINNQQKPYMTFHSLEEDDSVNPEPVDFYPDAIHHMFNGLFEFGIGILLEESEGWFPKKRLLMKVSCRQDNETFRVTILDKTVTCDFDGETSTDIENAYRMIADHLLKFLEKRPGDDSDISKFGFHSA